MFTDSLFFSNMQIEIMTKWKLSVLLVAAVCSAATAHVALDNQAIMQGISTLSVAFAMDSTPIYVQSRTSKSERTLSGRKDGKRLDFTLTEGVLTHLTVDGRSISKSEFYKYENLTNEILSDMNAQAESRLQIPHLPATPQIGETMPTGSTIEDKTILENLGQDGLMPPNAGEVRLKMTAKKFWVNDKEQSETLFQKYKGLIEAQRGRQICAGCEIELSLTPLHVRH